VRVRAILAKSEVARTLILRSEVRGYECQQTTNRAEGRAIELKSQSLGGGPGQPGSASARGMKW
jgi:hypothetical protein